MRPCSSGMTSTWGLGRSRMRKRIDLFVYSVYVMILFGVYLVRM